MNETTRFVGGGILRVLRMAVFICERCKVGMFVGKGRTVVFDCVVERV